VGAALIAVALLMFLFGTAWDIQWHPSVGRDRALTPPHLLMLGGIAASGLVSLAMVLLDTWRARSGKTVDEANSTRLFFLFRAPFGFAVSGFGALFSAIAFPLDDYWHVLYGIDVTLWAPFHVMILAGMIMVGLGVMYVLSSEMNRADSSPAKAWIGGGLAVTLALTLGVLLLFIPQANVAEGLARIGSYEFALFPVLLAFMLSITLVTVVRVTQRAGTATLLAVVLLAIQQGLFAFVPWAMDGLVAAEGLAYRPDAPDSVIVPSSYPIMILLAALIVDGVFWISRRSIDRRPWGTAAVLGAGAATAVLATFFDKPWTTIMPHYYPAHDMNALLLSALPFTLASALVGVGLAVLLSRGLSTLWQ
jgi:hypothetical protein